MPIVDGLTSTKMIRAYEESEKGARHSKLAKLNGRIPIFAVSASLVEKERQTYVDAGFDGWILKPIDFKRLNILLQGIQEEETRNASLYVPGEWERGGWFAARSDHDEGAESDDTTPKAEGEERDSMMTAEEAKAEAKAVHEQVAAEGEDSETTTAEGTKDEAT